MQLVSGCDLTFCSGQNVRGYRLARVAENGPQLLA